MCSWLESRTSKYPVVVGGGLANTKPAVGSIWNVVPNLAVLFTINSHGYYTYKLSILIFSLFYNNAV